MRILMQSDRISLYAIHKALPGGFGDIGAKPLTPTGNKNRVKNRSA